MGDGTQHNVYNIPAEMPFLKTFARYLMQQTGGDPQTLTQYRILLPTRRACRLLREVFLNLNDGRSMLLPQLTPIGDVDEEDLSLMMFGDAQRFLDIPAAIAPMKRQLLLAKLIQKVPDFAQGPEHALSLASALGQFMDTISVEELEFSELHTIVPEEFAAHWQITLSFLKIISEAWPEILAEQGLIDAPMRRNLLLNALAEYWEDHPPSTPIIAAGSTGSIPAVGRLLNVIAQMPQGQVILPGLDCHMDEDAWQYVEENHPQYHLKKLLSRMGIAHDDVAQINVDPDAKRSVSRAALASELMLPAQKVACWKSFSERHDAQAMLDGVEYYACATQQEEASAIALMMRETLEVSESVCALVTPDRGLARRVSALCRRWGIEVDDSAGVRLMDHRLGKFIVLSLEAVRGGFNPVDMLSLMKTPLCRLSYDDQAYNRAVIDLESLFLRKGHILPSYDALRSLIAEDEAHSELLGFLDCYLDGVKPLSYYASMDDVFPFEDILRAHLRVLEMLACRTDLSGAEVLWRGDSGEAGAQFFTEVLQHASLIGDVRFDEYCDVLSALLRSVTVRSAYGVHPRLLILGQLEARLSDADLVVLGGLNEGVWPPDPGHDPWMSRPMRAEFGLPGTEQMVGIAAHDFVQGFCSAHIVLTRSEKLDSGPSVPARWLERFETVLQGMGKTLSDLSLHPYQKWAMQLDESDVFVPCERPEPRPPLAARPVGASVTKIETWMQNPYAIYMHYVLSLRKIEPLIQDNDAALRGSIMHEILDRFTQEFPLNLPDHAQDRFLEIAREVLEEKIESPQQLLYWWPRYLKIAAWFVAHEKGWREQAKYMESEIKGHVDLDIAGESFTLYGMADRIDRMHGGYALIDYKSGGTYSPSKLKKGEMPQLPLEGLILSQGGFDGKGFKNARPDEVKKRVPAGDSVYLGYWKLTGGRKAGEVSDVSGDLSETIEIVEEGLRSLITVFRDMDTPFYCIPDASRAPRFNDYEHISRQKEWSALDGSSDGEAA